LRQLIVQVPRGDGAAALDIARRHGGTNVAVLAGEGEDGPRDLVLIHSSNARLEGLLDALEALPGLRVSLFPTGVIALRPPPSEAPDQVLDVAPRSPVEIFLGGLQSVGSWQGFLAYAAAAGVVAWIGLSTDTVYLLTAAMLIAPFAGPAMNAALATARGDGRLFGRSLLRYAAGLATAILVSLLLGLAFGPSTPTRQMVDTSLVSSFAVLLPLVAGAAGAVHLCNSERNSLVSGAATGMLVAASLAPPAGLIGIAAANGDWPMARAAVFLLLLQLAGINAAGAVVFRLYGVSPGGARFARGRPGVSYGAWAASLAAVAALLAWQFAGSPELRHATRSQRAETMVRDVASAAGAEVIDAEVRFTRAGGEALLVLVYVAEPPADLDSLLRRRLAEAFAVRPLVRVVPLSG